MAEARKQMVAQLRSKERQVRDLSWELSEARRDLEKLRNESAVRKVRCGSRQAS